MDFRKGVAGLVVGALFAAHVAGEETLEDEVWDVGAAEYGESFEVAIDVDEGTWINLDVSPDGREIVFDLLGDLFLIPIEGGEAVAFSSGVEWDMQPRFSPDGSRIAFTSDRGGGDNIWVMDTPVREESEPRAVTDEGHRLLNNPAWSPDGDFIAARKHFTSTRSAGAGEIWLYHRSGPSPGLQLNEKPNDQKDLGEPAFSPDGRYVYFSRDSTAGEVFDYGKDPNDQIYSIRRIDRETGEIEVVVSRLGGAVRPTPSPDGQSLAFVGRDEYRSRLFVHDLESGENRVVVDDLDRDMQEIWAIHGVYANFAWTPDSESIVFWAGGEIRRVWLEGGEVREIPFRVRQHKSMKRAIRFPVEVAPETPRTKMLRWVQVSPDGGRAIFQALGKLWIRELPAGEPRRLTGQEDHFELYPSFSRDGSQVVYVSWSDDELGAVRVLSADGSEGRVVTSEPGHYLEPALSPDGETLVYRKTAGFGVLDPLWSKEPGLYRLDLASGEAERLHRSGTAPHFGALDDRVYFTQVFDWNHRELRSIELDGTEERSHIKSELATEMRVSPDGRWLAFAEGFQAFVAPFVAASKPVGLGPATTSVPLRRLSKDAGESLHWSGDSSTVFWSMGPELFERALSDSFTFVDGAPDDLPEAEEIGLDLGFEFEADVPSGVVAFRGGRVLTMAEGDDGEIEVIPNATVVVERNRIIAVGRRGSVSIPAEAYVVDARGKTLMPGLIDVHWHGSQGSNGIVPERNWQNYASLAFGVTTAHNPSTDTSTFFAASEMARAGLVIAPRLFSTGTILYGADGAIRAKIETLDDARSHLKRLKAAGAFSVKSYNQPRRDQRQKVLKAAHEVEMMVVNEGGALFQHNMTMVADGHTGIEHSLSVPKVYDDVLQFWGQTEVGNTPTLGVAYGGIQGENYWYQHTDVWKDERLLSFVPKDRIWSRTRRREMAPDGEYNHLATAGLVKDLRDAGVSIQLGAHGQREGLAAHWELWMFEQGGMTPMEALRAGTIAGAKYLGLDGDLGSIEAGKLADIIVLDGDPLEDLRQSRTVRWVMVNGRLFEAATMNEVGNHPRERGRFYFE